MKKAGYNIGGINPAWVIVAMGVLMNAALWILTLWVFPRHSPVAVLHYTVGVGIDFIGQGNQIIMLPLIGTILLVGNIFMAYAVARASLKSSWIFLSITPILQVILLGAFVVLWRLNI